MQEPMGAMTMGALASLPSNDVRVSGALTSFNMRGVILMRSKAARLSRKVISSSAPPSINSNTVCGKRFFASKRKSAMLNACASRESVCFIGRVCVEGRKKFESQESTHSGM